MTGRLACAEYSFPAIPASTDRLAMVAAMGFSSAGVGLFYSTGDALVARTSAIADGLRAALETHGLSCDDVFLTVGETVEAAAPNLRDRGARALARREFLAALDVATSVGAGGVTVLPGTSWGDDPRGAWSACVEELRWRTDAAGSRGLEVRIEPHLGAIVPIPELVSKLCEEVPALRLTLDLSHFDAQSVTIDRVLGLVALVGHVHVRGSKPGAVQVRWRESEADVAALVAALEAAGYAGSFCVEYVPMVKWRCDEMDVVTEAIATRDALSELGIR